MSNGLPSHLVVKAWNIERDHFVAGTGRQKVEQRLGIAMRCVDEKQRRTLACALKVQLLTSDGQHVLFDGDLPGHNIIARPTYIRIYESHLFSPYPGDSGPSSAENLLLNETPRPHFRCSTAVAP